MAYVLARRHLPWQVRRRTDPALEPSGLHRSAVERRTGVLQSVTDQQGLTRGDSNALTVDRIERAIRIADREQTGRPGAGSPVAVAPIASLPVDRDVTDRVEPLG